MGKSTERNPSNSEDVLSVVVIINIIIIIIIITNILTREEEEEEEEKQNGEEEERGRELGEADAGPSTTASRISAKFCDIIIMPETLVWSFFSPPAIMIVLEEEQVEVYDSRGEHETP